MIAAKKLGDRIIVATEKIYKYDGTVIDIKKHLVPANLYAEIEDGYIVFQDVEEAYQHFGVEIPKPPQPPNNIFPLY